MRPAWVVAGQAGASRGRFLPVGWRRWTAEGSGGAGGFRSSVCVTHADGCRDRCRGSVGGGVNPRVFISYAHDDAAHEEVVQQFWVFLRRNGIDAKLDAPAAETPQDWPVWMLHEFEAADFVLMVASPAYRRRPTVTPRRGKAPVCSGKRS